MDVKFKVYGILSCKDRNKLAGGLVYQSPRLYDPIVVLWSVAGLNAQDISLFFSFCYALFLYFLFYSIYIF